MSDEKPPNGNAEVIANLQRLQDGFKAAQDERIEKRTPKHLRGTAVAPQKVRALKARPKPKSRARANKQRRGGMPRFEPTQAQRFTVAGLAGAMSAAEICRLILNERTGKRISLETLYKYFPEELADGRSKLKATILSAYYEKIDEGSENSILFGMRAILGLDDRNPASASMSMKVAGPDGKSSVEVSFCWPDKPEPDDPPPAAAPRRIDDPKVIEGKALPPSSVPLVSPGGRKRSWME